MDTTPICYRCQVKGQHLSYSKVEGDMQLLCAVCEATLTIQQEEETEWQIQDNLKRSKRIRVLETELLKLYMKCGDLRMHEQITQVIEAALHEGASAERYKEFYKNHE